MKAYLIYFRFYLFRILYCFTLSMYRLVVSSLCVEQIQIVIGSDHCKPTVDAYVDIRYHRSSNSKRPNVYNLYGIWVVNLRRVNWCNPYMLLSCWWRFFKFSLFGPHHQLNICLPFWSVMAQQRNRNGLVGWNSFRTTKYV